MQALHYVGPNNLEWLEIDAPVLVSDTDVLVQPLAVAACDLDRSITAGNSPFHGPFVLGHSSVCSSVPGTSMYGIGAAGGDWSGALADLIRVPWGDVNLRRIAGGLDTLALASASDNLADGLRAVDQPLAAFPGGSVLVAGTGSIPLYALLCAQHLGAEQLTFASGDRFALQVADSLGAACLEITDWPSRFRSHDITLDCTGTAQGLAAVIRSTAGYGHCTSASIYFSDLTPVPMRNMYMQGISFNTRRVNSAAMLDRVLQLALEGLDPNRIQPQLGSW